MLELPILYMRTNSVAIALVINGLEYYCLSLYGFFSVTLAPIFFSDLQPYQAYIASLITFAIGFLMNPLGGIVFGYIGDHYGRKHAMAISILLTTIPTLTIGLLPSFNMVGFFSPLTLLICRLIQGFAVGGQAYGNVVFVMEHAKKGRVNLACSVLAASSLAGAVIGSFSAHYFLQDWGWRIPFLLGGIIGLILYRLRIRLKETEVFEEKTETYPLKKSLKLLWNTQRRNLLATTFISAASTVPFYFIVIYTTNIILPLRFPEESGSLMSITSIIILFWMISLPLMGYIADRFKAGFQLMWISSVILAVFAFPFMWIIENCIYFSGVFGVLIFMSFISAAFVAPSSSYMANLFPPKLRCLGTSIAASFGTCVFAGTSPLISEALKHYTNNPYSPSLYLAACSIIGIVGILIGKGYTCNRIAVSQYFKRNIALLKKLLFNNGKAIPTLNKYGYMLTANHEYSHAFIDFSKRCVEPVLDIGAAYGFTAIEALKKGANVIANDLDGRHLQILQNSIPASFQARLQLKVGRVPNDISFKSCSLGAVNASGVLHFLHIEEIQQTLRLIYDWLKPGGKFFIASSSPYNAMFSKFLPVYENNKKIGHPWPGMVSDTSVYLPDLSNQIPSPLHLMDEDTLTFLLAEAGFLIKKIGYFNVSLFVEGDQSYELTSIGAIAIKM